MKAVRIGLIGLAALSVLAPSANAQQTINTVTLVQKFQPVTRSYPGVAADALGIQTGMTVSQAETIAEKSYPGQPMVQRARGLFKYKEVTAWSQPFIQNVWFVNRTAESSDQLALFFGTPVTGNTLYGIGRYITFGVNGKFGGDPASSPLASTLEASLIEKYGPPSYQLSDKASYSVLTWAFSDKSHAPCQNDDCAPQTANFVPVTPIRRRSKPTNDMNPNDMTAVDMASLDLSSTNSSKLNSNKYQLKLLCASDVDHPNSLIISADIRFYLSDPTKVDHMSIAIWDPSTCINDAEKGVRQMRVGAIEFYNKTSKTPAAPKL